MSEAKCLNCLLTERLHIKDNITNGDVIKALFLNDKICETADSVMVIGSDFQYQCHYPKNWWNAPYKGE